ETGQEAAQVARGPMVEMAVFEGDEPMSGDGAPVDVRPETAPHAGGHRHRVVVVDDNPGVREDRQGCLAGPYTVAVATHGLEALEMARENVPDLILSDVMMPHMNGYELCRAVRADAALQHVPLVLITSKASLDDKIEGLEAGADDYLTKPFNAQELFARVNNLLQLREHEKALKEAIEMKSEVLRIAAHDLRNPLNSIREFAKLVRERFDDGDEAVELLDLIHNASEHMLQL